MVSVSHTDLQTLLNIDAGTLSDEDAETVLDDAIDKLNLYGRLAIPNMNGGAPGAKTVTLTSPQRGAVLGVAKACYYRGYGASSSESIAIGNISKSGSSSSAATMLNDPDAVAITMARYLNDPSFLLV